MQNETVKKAYMYDTVYANTLKSFGIIITVFVMFFLISSNNSFIRARKKEVSTYALFGMRNRRIGMLLFMETIAVGIAALVIGIAAGVFFSKLTAMILLDISLASFKGDISFTIAPRAMYVTALLFLGIFCIMGLSGLYVINKFELAELFKAEKVSEGKSRGSLTLLAVSLVLTGTGYCLAGSNNPITVLKYCIPILLLVITGTYIFFNSGLPRLLHILKKAKNSYYKAPNLIAISALSHRVRTISSVMATIAVLSAVATTAISFGYTLYSNVYKNTYENVGYDMYLYGAQQNLLDEIDNIFKKHNVRIIERYTTNRNVCTSDALEINGSWKWEFSSANADYFRVYSETVYNRLLSISRCDYSRAVIKPGEAMFVCYYLDDDISGEVMGKELSFENRTITIASTLRARFICFGAVHALVLNDEDYDLLSETGYITGRYPDGGICEDVTIYKYENPLGLPELSSELIQLLKNRAVYNLAFSHYNESMKIFGLVCFIGFFMCAVFILMTASLLYFKQVTAAEEERQQYATLRKIGMPEAVEKKVITRRLLPVFFIPLAVGITHSILAMKSADTVIFSDLIPAGNSFTAVLACSAVMYVVYAFVYFIFYLVTRSQYSRIVQ